MAEHIDWPIVEHAIENATMRLGLAKVDINESNASLRQPVEGAGYQLHSYRAALIVASAKHEGVAAELEALKSAKSSPPGAAPKPPATVIKPSATPPPKPAPPAAPATSAGTPTAESFR
jgi:hypothetical protein